MTKWKAISVKRAGRVVVVCFRLESLRYGGMQEIVLRDDLRQLLEHIQSSNVIADLDGVAQCSSGTLGVLIEMQKELTRRGGQLSLCCVNDHLREKFRTLNLDTLFPIYDNESEAIAAVEP